MRARKPCLRFRRRTFGWYVRFTSGERPSRRCARTLRARRSAEYRRGPPARVIHTRPDRRCARNGCSRARLSPGETRPDTLSTAVETRVETLEVPANCAFFCLCSRSRGALAPRPEGGMLAPPATPEGASSTALVHAGDRTAEQLWDDVSRRLRDTLNETTHATWFGAAGGAHLSDEAFVVVVPNDFTREWIESHFLGLVRAATRDV